MNPEPYFMCEDCGCELPTEQLCCGDFNGDGSIVDGHCIGCCAFNHRGSIWAEKNVAGGTFERCDCDC